MTPANDWAGEERRGLPIHILNYVDERMTLATGEITRYIHDHTKEETERYGEMIDRQDQLENKINHLENSVQEVTEIVGNNSKSIKQLTESVNAWMQNNSELLGCIRKAFPRDDHGEPDFDGHRTAHNNWIKNAPEEKELMSFMRSMQTKMIEDKARWDKIAQNVLSGIIFAVVTFVGIAAWAAFIKGPAG